MARLRSARVATRRRARLCVFRADGPGRRTPPTFFFCDVRSRRGIATTCGANGTIDADNPGTKGRAEPHNAICRMSLHRYAAPRFFLLPGPLPGPNGWRVPNPSSVVATR